MADTKKLAALKVLSSWLAGITPGNGYEFDLSGPAAISRGRTIIGADTPLPSLSILESPKPDVGLFAGFRGYTFSEDWLLLVQGWVADDKANPTDPAYALAAAVQKRLSGLIAEKASGSPVNPDVYMLGGRAATILIGPYVVRPPENQVSSKAFFFLPLRVGIQTDVSQPYDAA